MLRFMVAAERESVNAAERAEKKQVLRDKVSACAFCYFLFWTSEINRHAPVRCNTVLLSLAHMYCMPISIIPF